MLPKSPMGQAIAYALNQWNALRRYAEQRPLNVVSLAKLLFFML